MRQFISGAFVTTKHVRSVSQDLIPNKAQVGEVTVNFNLWQIRPAIVFDSHFAANNIIIGFRNCCLFVPRLEIFRYSVIPLLAKHCPYD